MKKRNLFIETFKGYAGDRKAFWLMRQAGRYLPEYRELRSKAGSFLNLCFNPDYAAEVTLQPIRRFDMDAAILFSDILTVPFALGQDLTFQEGGGPRLGEYKNAAPFAAAKNDDFVQKLEPVYQAVKKIKQSLQEDKALIGFAGAPWTVSCYMIQGRGDKTFSKVKDYAKNNPEDYLLLQQTLIDKTLLHLEMQIAAGVDAIQLFDSWAGLLDEDDLLQHSIKPVDKIISKLKEKHPNIPVILFPKGISNYKKILDNTEIDGLSLGSEIDLKDSFAAVGDKVVLQGNLSPETLLKGGQEMVEEINKILAAAKGKKFIFNLGHGVLKETPPENVALLAKTVKEYES